MASLTTHILDTANGIPAAGVTIEIIKVSGDKRVTLRTLKTNDDGRTDSPVLAGDQCIPGVYELVFHIGDYFSLDTVPVRFTMAPDEDHYHVPLLASPWSYSTYRGS